MPVLLEALLLADESRASLVGTRGGGGGGIVRQIWHRNGITHSENLTYKDFSFTLNFYFVIQRILLVGNWPHKLLYEY